jgi:hypothetical protein
VRSQNPFFSPIKKFLLFGSGSLTLITSLIVIGFWRGSDRLISLAEKFLLPQPIVPRIELATAIVKQVQEVQELTTAVYTMETVVPASAERKIGEWVIATTKLVYIAHGEVRAGIDFNQLTPQQIKITPDKIKINLPPPQILDQKIDVNRSRVFDYNRGFLNLGPDLAPQLQTQAQQETLKQIVHAACDQGILNSANQKAKQTLTQLLNHSSKQPIEIKTTSPSSQACI